MHLLFQQKNRYDLKNIKDKKGSLFMNYSRLFLISVICITATFYASSSILTNPSIKFKAQQEKKSSDTEKEIEIWLQNYFAKKSFKEEITYTPELFNNIKKHLLTHGYIQYVPHKDLKKIVKNKIIYLHAKKHQTDKWISKHKKNIKGTITHYLQTHPHAKPQNIIEYLNNPSCKNKTCKQLQIALRDSNLLPELIKQTIKKIIKTVQK